MCLMCETASVSVQLSFSRPALGTLTNCETAVVLVEGDEVKGRGCHVGPNAPPGKGVSAGT